jgi:hypothetical protein
MTTTPKHLDAFTERENCRARVLELRRVHGAKSEECYRLGDELEKLETAIGREQTKLVDLTRQTTQLLNADLAGVLPAVTPATRRAAVALDEPAAAAPTDIALAT